MSNKREREKRREDRLREESKAQAGDRRTRLLQLGAGAVFLVIIVVVVLIVANGSSSSGGGGKKEGTPVEIAAVNKLLKGIPQEGLTLGDPKAKVRLFEYGDLQCPICKAYSEEVLPQIIEKQIRNGEANITFRSFTIIGPQSVPAGQAALAAGEQGRGWNFIELFYRNQGEEDSGYATGEFFTWIAEGASVPNMSKWRKERESKRFEEEVHGTTEQAEHFGFTGTPSFAIRGPHSNGLELLGTPGGAEPIEEAIKKAG
jgi:protein-disulfide isomerase